MRALLYLNQGVFINPYGEHFAEEVIEECASFPYGQYDDYVDSTTQAVLRYRQGNFVSTYMDEPETNEDRRRI
jgi:phage terminase large subunit-like protein